MSFNPIPGVCVNQEGHVPVGTGRQLPEGPQRQQQTTAVLLERGFGPNVLQVNRSGSGPARRIPPGGLAQMRGRARHVHGSQHTVVPQLLARNPRRGC